MAPEITHLPTLTLTFGKDTRARHVGRGSVTTAAAPVLPEPANTQDSSGSSLTGAKFQKRRAAAHGFGY